MPKVVPMEQRKLAPVTAMLPLRLREQVAQLAAKHSVSASEIGRRAIQEYVRKQGAKP